MHTIEWCLVNMTEKFCTDYQVGKPAATIIKLRTLKYSQQQMEQWSVKIRQFCQIKTACKVNSFSYTPKEQCLPHLLISYVNIEWYVTKNWSLCLKKKSRKFLELAAKAYQRVKKKAFHRTRTRTIENCILLTHLKICHMMIRSSKGGLTLDNLKLTIKLNRNKWQ